MTDFSTNIKVPNVGDLLKSVDFNLIETAITSAETIIPTYSNKYNTRYSFCYSGHYSSDYSACYDSRYGTCYSNCYGGRYSTRYGTCYSCYGCYGCYRRYSSRYGRYAAKNVQIRC